MAQNKAQEADANLHAGTQGPRGSRFSRRAWRLGFALLILVILADLALRFGLGLGNPILYLYQRSPRAGYVLTPNQHTWRFLATNTINRWGMRCKDFTLKRPAGTYRVMFLGDSVTYGTTFVDQSKLFTTRLASTLPKIMHQPVQVLNASCGAWAIGNELGYLKARGTFHSNLVVLVINTGDLTQPFNPSHLASDTSYPDTPPLCAISELWFRYLWPRVRGLAPFRDQGSYVAKTQPVHRPDVEQSLDQMRQLCLRNGARFAIVFHPFAGSKWQAKPFPDDLKRLQAWCSAQHVPFLSLKHAYAKAPASLVYYSGVHLRPLGNKLAAQAIAAHWNALTGHAAASPSASTGQTPDASAAPLASR